MKIVIYISIGILWLIIVPLVMGVVSPRYLPDTKDSEDPGFFTVFLVMSALLWPSMPIIVLFILICIGLGKLLGLYIDSLR